MCKNKCPTAHATLHCTSGSDRLNMIFNLRYWIDWIWYSIYLIHYLITYSINRREHLLFSAFWLIQHININLIYFCDSLCQIDQELKNCFAGAWRRFSKNTLRVQHWSLARLDSLHRSLLCQSGFSWANTLMLMGTSMFIWHSRFISFIWGVN